MLLFILVMHSCKCSKYCRLLMLWWSWTGQAHDASHAGSCKSCCGQEHRSEKKRNLCEFSESYITALISTNLINWYWITVIIVNLIQDKTLKCVGYSNMISMILDPMIHIHIYTVRAIYALNTCIHSKLSLQFEMLIPPPNPIC